MHNVEIRVKGYLDQHWSEWFEGFEIAHSESDETILTGQVPDQAALYGILTKIRNLGLSLIAVIPKEIQNSCE
jgi:hypothetical protein